MNKQEIDDMMKDLPSQQLPEETVLQKLIIGIMLIAFLMFWMWVPDFTLDEEDCMKQESSAYVKNLCKESKAK
jgi:hypothetical protein